MKKIILLVMSFLSLLTYAIPTPYLAVTSVPVVNLIGQPLTNDLAAFSHDTFPLCGSGRNAALACPRLHQLLFNEIVDVLEERGEEVYIKIPHLFYVTQASVEPQANYWTLKKYFIPLQTLAHMNCAMSTFPTPINFKHGTLEHALNNTVTLIHPFNDPVADQIYSAGTRFVRADQDSDKKGYDVLILEPRDFSVNTVTIPKKLCIAHEEMNQQASIKQFIEIIHAWAHPPEGHIPYVWGGCSFATPYENIPFKECAKSHKKTKASYYCHNRSTDMPHTGFDCSGLIARAAHIAGIPYFYKNTQTIEKHLKRLTKNDTLSAGDLIMIRGHVMIVANIAKNTLIEASSYLYGSGRVHEVKLNKVFKGIRTYQELVEASLNNKPFTRLNSLTGNSEGVLPRITLLRLASAWDAQEYTHKKNPPLQ